MSFFKRLRKRVSKVAHKVEHVAIKTTTPGLSKKSQKRLEHTVDVGNKFTSQVGKAALIPSHKNILHVKKESKVVTRNIARAGAKPLVYATGAVTAVASYFFTPIAGAIVGGALSSANYYVGSTAARAKGIHGRAARHAGRVERKKSINAALIGMSIGGAGAAVGTAVAGASSGAGAGLSAVGLGSSAGTISAVGGATIAAGGKIIPAILAQQAGTPSSTPSLPSGAATLPIGGSSTTINNAPTPVPWALLALIGGVAVVGIIVF
jgi:hypothetical protein